MLNASEGFEAGERIAKFATLAFITIGLVEALVGHLTNSASLTADAIHSFADATILMIIWMGLRFSKKAPDERFHFGYLKVESLAALLASIGMLVVASSLLYMSYQRFLHPLPIAYPQVALLTLLGAGSASFYVANLVRKIAKRYQLLSLRTGAHNSIKDASASFVAFGAVLLASLGFHQMDAIGGMIIAGYIYFVAYISIKEASLVLIDACHRPELVQEVKRLIEGKYEVEVEEVKMRRAGPYIEGILNLAADGSLTLEQVDRIKEGIKEELRHQIDGLKELEVVVRPKKPLVQRAMDSPDAKGEHN